MPIELQETLRAVFYTPFYAAFALGAFEDEGLDVRLATAPAKPSESIQRLLRGEVDINWGGPMRVIMARDKDPSLDLVCLCEVVRADPFYLVGRTPNPDFSLSDLRGRTIATVKDVPTPWACLQEDIRRAGVDIGAVNFVSTGTMAENAAGLRAGQLDLAQFFEPYVDELIESGDGHIWYCAADRGLTAYTSFYCRRDMLESRRNEFLAMTRAIYKVQRWLKESPPQAIAAVVTRYFPSISMPSLARAIDRYLTHGIWSETPVLDEAGYERLRASLLSAGLVKNAVEFGTAVDNRFAREVVNETIRAA